MIGTSLNPNFPAGLQTNLNRVETTLDNYNSPGGLGCTEGSGLNAGS
jgi:hypothetical protein